MNNRFFDLYNSLKCSGNPDQEFFHLGGPMHHMPKYNYTTMSAAAELLRNNGYNLICPHEFPSDECNERAITQDGDYETMQRNWKDFMQDTLTVLCMPTCVGAIFLPEWRESRDCQIEVALMQGLGKQVFELSTEPELDDCPALTFLAPEGYSPFLAVLQDCELSNAGAVEISFDSLSPGLR